MSESCAFIVASRIKKLLIGLGCVCYLGAVAPALADGVTAYLPLNLEPETERLVERVLILADEPILKRPIAVALVQLALPKACEADKVLCKKITRYLERYTRDYAVTHASIAASANHGASIIDPNQRGLTFDSHYDVSAQGFVQPNDHVLASAGVVIYHGRTEFTGSMLSFGFNWAQIDIGYRDHWLSPVTDSTMMVGTEAPTMPSVTLSNYEPLTRLGFQYEFFLARMASSDHILRNGQGTAIEGRGEPKLFGAQFSIEPFSGWSIGANRQLQYGGAGLPDSARFLARDFFKPGGQSQTQGNQEASYVSRFIFPGKSPFAVYAQYAGENTLNGGSYLLGQSSLTFGIDVPKLGRYFDLTYETAEWQNGWYVNSVFLDGMTNDRLVLGQWGADQRLFNDGVGARSQMLRLGWEPPFGGYLEGRLRTLVNQNYGAFPYHHFLDVTLRYSRPWHDITVGGEVDAGRDIFGESFSRFSGFVRYGGDPHVREVQADEEEPGPNYEAPLGTELFVDAGAEVHRVREDAQKGMPVITSNGVGPHGAIGARRAVSDNNDLGVRVEFDRVDGNALIGVRALDYRYRFGDNFAMGAFLGVDRYAVATPAYSLYGGIGAQWRNVLPKWDIGIDVRHAQNIARTHVLASDPPGVRPDTFYKIESLVTYTSWHF